MTTWVNAFAARKPFLALFIGLEATMLATVFAINQKQRSTLHIQGRMRMPHTNIPSAH